MKKSSLNIRSLVLVVTAVATLFALPLQASADSEYGHWDKARHAEFLQKRQEELHDKLGITEAQETAWKEFITKSTLSEHKTRPDWSELSKLSTPERLDRVVASAKEREQSLAVRAKVVKEFYGHLTEDQKKIFDDIHSHHRPWNGWHHHHGCQHHHEHEDGSRD